MQVPHQQNDSNLVENDRNADELKSNPSEVVLIDPKQIEDTPKTHEIVISDSSAAKNQEIEEETNLEKGLEHDITDEAILMTAPKLEMTPDSEEPVVVVSVPVEIYTKTA
ncbi:unnamed protein product [Oikopleura dioica]|uniref:Uncharacterized protein n=1 Tax=Oikopleura dioica TaxID=34765 RepID=E4Z5E1_OIKDI|nr:unnamed protein product [Oikopleura dioica]